MKNLKYYKRVIAEVQATYVTKNQIHSAKMNSPNKVNEYVRKIFPVDINYREAFMCIYLNRANNVQAYSVISIGGISGTVADPKVIFQHALLCNATSFIMIHNHPSGSLKPSQSDIQLTKKMAQVGECMTLPVTDHIIIGSKGFFSFADEGLI